MENSIHGDLIRGHINTIILKALYEGDKYGYEIIKEISERTKGQYTLKQPTLYACLKRMEIQGFIKSYWNMGTSGGGRRKYFTLTNVGRNIYMKNQAEWEFSRTMIDSLVSDKKYTYSPTVGKDSPASILQEDYNEEMEIDIDEELNEEGIKFEVDVAMQENEKKENVEKTDDDEIINMSAPAKEVNATDETIDGQVDLFDNISVNVDKKIEDYEKVSRIYDEVNTRKPQSITSDGLQEDYNLSEETNEIDVDIDDSEITSYHKIQGITPVQKHYVGFDAQTSKFIPTASLPSYTESILNDEQQKKQAWRVKRVEHEEPPQVVEIQPVVQQKPRERQVEEYRETETQAEKEYRTILKKLLQLTKSHIVTDEAISATSPLIATKQDNKDSKENKENVFVQSLPQTEEKNQMPPPLEDEKVLQYRPRGNIDLTDLQAKMQTEGFKIRTRSTSIEQTQTVSLGYIKLAPLSITTSMITFFIVLVELLIIYFAAPVFEMGLTLFIVLCCVSALIPIIGFCLYSYYKNKKSYDKFAFSYTFLLSLIVAISIFMVCTSVAFFTGADLSILSVTLKFIALPAILAVNIPLSVIIFALLRNRQRLMA